MAKPNKKVAAKSRSNSSKKNKGFLSKIDFKSGKTQFFLASMLVIVAGGVYFTYKSFAATGTIASIPASSLGYGITEQRASTGKSNQRVSRLTVGKSISWQLQGNTINPSNRYKFCATVRKESPTNYPKINLEVQQLKGASLSSKHSGNFTETRYAALQDKYQNVCTKWFNGWGRDDVRITIRNIGPGDARVGAVSLQKL